MSAGLTPLKCPSPISAGKIPSRICEISARVFLDIILDKYSSSLNEFLKVSSQVWSYLYFALPFALHNNNNDKYFKSTFIKLLKLSSLSTN